MYKYEVQQITNTLQIVLFSTQNVKVHKKQNSQKNKIHKKQNSQNKKKQKKTKKKLQ